jgi:hypothetical protein
MNATMARLMEEMRLKLPRALEVDPLTQEERRKRWDSLDHLGICAEISGERQDAGGNYILAAGPDPGHLKSYRKNSTFLGTQRSIERQGHIERNMGVPAE